VLRALVTAAAIRARQLRIRLEAPEGGAWTAAAD
jgi:hypothetical protein